MVVGVFLFSCVLPTSSSAQSKPLPGKWEKKFTGFGFDEKTKTYLPMVDSKETECLSEAYFQEKSFHVPNFAAQESERQGRRCVVSNEGPSGSTKTWRQVCTDTNGSTEDERWVISISSDELALEHDTLATKRLDSGIGLEAKSKQVIWLKRIGECDKAVKAQPEANPLSQVQTQKSEQESSDRRYEVRDGGIVRDTKTGREWMQSDNGSEINWSDAMRYCAGKGGGWRLGSPDELESLYDASQSTSCGTQTCKVSSKFRLTDTWFWSNELKSSSYAWSVYLHLNAPFRSLHHVNPRYYSRALCVRYS